jgi:hypothetical protein
MLKADGVTPLACVTRPGGRLDAMHEAYGGMARGQGEQRAALTLAPPFGCTHMNYNKVNLLYEVSTNGKRPTHH